MICKLNVFHINCVILPLTASEYIVSRKLFKILYIIFWKREKLISWAARARAWLLVSQTTERNGMKLSQIKYIHVLELLELFKIFLETLNFRTKIVSQFWNWPFFQTTRRNGMRLSQIAYIRVLQLLESFWFFLSNFQSKLWYHQS
jgi:hypothetical protein